MPSPHSQLWYKAGKSIGAGIVKAWYLCGAWAALDLMACETHHDGDHGLHQLLLLIVIAIIEMVGIVGASRKLLKRQSISRKIQTLGWTLVIVGSGCRCAHLAIEWLGIFFEFCGSSILRPLESPWLHIPLLVLLTALGALEVAEAWHRWRRAILVGVLAAFRAFGGLPPLAVVLSQELTLTHSRPVVRAGLSSVRADHAGEIAFSGFVGFGIPSHRQGGESSFGRRIRNRGPPIRSMSLIRP